MESAAKKSIPFSVKIKSHLKLRRTVILAAAVAFFLFSVLPILYMLALSLVDQQGDLSFENYRKLLAFDARQRQLLLNSVVLGFATAFTSTVLGVPLGFLLARAEFALKNILRFLLIIPLVIPPYIFALAWVLLFGKTMPGFTYSLFGAVLVLGLCFYPLPMLATETALRSVDGRMEEAALLAAPPLRVFWRITMPLISPIIAASFLIVFVLAAAEFGVPGLLRVRVFTTEIFTAFAALYDFGAATALAVPSVLITLFATLFAAKSIGNKTLVGSRRGFSAMKLTRGISTISLLTTACFIVLAAVILPVSALFYEAIGVRNIENVVLDSGPAIRNSLVLSAIGATLVVVAAVFLGYARGRAKSEMSWVADAVFVVTFAVPSTIVGVGIIGLWNHSFTDFIYSSQAIIVIGYLARFIPIGALILGGIVRQVPYSIEEAAAMSGAGWLRIFSRIVLPNLKFGIAGTWIIIFIFTFGELGATLLVAPPGDTTLPVRIYTIIANTPPSEIAALALLQIAVVVFPLTFLVFWRGQEKKT